MIFEAHPQRYVGLGKAHLKLSNVTAAIAAFEQAAQIDPTKRTLERLVAAYTQAGRSSDIREVYKRIHALDPTDHVAARNLGIHLPTARQ